MLGFWSHLHTFLSSFVETYGLNLTLHCEIKNGAVKHEQWSHLNNTKTLSFFFPPIGSRKRPNSGSVACVRNRSEYKSQWEGSASRQEAAPCRLRPGARLGVTAVEVATNSQTQVGGVPLGVSVVGGAWRGSRDVRASRWWAGWTDTPMMPSGWAGRSGTERRVWERHRDRHLNLNRIVTEREWLSCLSITFLFF